ncbi:C4-dicarboxylate ABC transporter permease [Roseibium algicola]|mgnify:CR=1 FL=1|uniref:TRAP transporter large permease protein n=1 Tax=Roseibium algicola TaxID=2857014 RepID=A0ABM6I0U3_9HYPH|nr:TRAP transporter large permease [Roseibium aggregatum]AQQ03948.1 C4-dicarboxylate ABC transporter permease [Roseibium aggregatum]
MEIFLPFVCGLILFMALGLPVFVALGTTCLLALAVTSATGGLPVELMSLKITQTLNSFPLLAIPLFILAANLLNRGSATTRIFDFANVLVGFVRGGLGHVNVVASMIFAGMSGTASADAAGLGALEIRAMSEKGYNLSYSTGITAASSVIGPIIPPSVAMLVYGWQADVSVGDLFLGGFVPGLLMAGLLMATTFLMSYRVEMPTRPLPSPREVFQTGHRAMLPMFTPLIIVGGIWSGVFSPTEAGAVACFYAMVLGIAVYRDVKVSDLFRVFVHSMEFSAVILLIIAISGFYGWLLVRLQVPQTLASSLIAIGLPPILLLLILMVFFILVGCFMSVIESVLILTPILVPAVSATGIDPLFFGVFMVITLSVGVITPPFGTVLYILVPITGLRFEKVVLAVLPFLVPILLTILLVLIFPQIVLTLPGLF